MTEPALRANALGVSIGREREHLVLEGVDLAVRGGSIHAVVGASGSGKSTLLRALNGSLPRNARATGSVTLARGVRIALPATTQRWLLRPTPATAGRVIATVAQSAANSLTPLRTVGQHLVETARARRVSVDAPSALSAVGLSADVAELYPHELSGGMAQRVAIALAVLGDPPVILADEPTSALDPDRKIAILHLLRAAADRGAAVVLVTHDIEALTASGVADDITVIDHGRVIESGPAARIMHGAQTALAREFFDPPAFDDDVVPAAESTSEPVLRAVDLAAIAGQTELFSDLQLEMRFGEVLGVSGESGSGKSTLVRILSGLQQPSTGEVFLGERLVRDVRSRAGKPTRGRIGVVFQNPRAALDPRKTLLHSLDIAVATANRRTGTVANAREVLIQVAHDVGLPREVLERRPAQVSDGQLQRFALIRALAGRPEVLLCDEITAALDPRATREVMSALTHIVRTRKIGVLLVSHDESLLERVAQRRIRLDARSRAAGAGAC